MLIEIKRDVIEEALKKRSQKQNEPLDLLFQLAICAKKGSHVVWVPSLVGDIPLRNELSVLITEANVNALCYAEEKHPHDVGRLNREMPVKAVITYKKEKPVKGKIVINPHQEPGFEPYTELFFLVENILDADFYKIVLKLYREVKGFASYECMMYPLMGGGSTTAKVMENEVRQCQHFCLAVADSDRHRVNGPIGRTADDLKNTITPYAFNCDVCWLEDVMEIENLIPRKIVRYLYPLVARKIDIFTKDPSFFDMKEGLTMYCLADDKDCDYWKGLLPERPAVFLRRDLMKARFSDKKVYEDKLKSIKTKIVDGFGCNLLKRVMNADQYAIQRVMNENIRANDMLYKTKLVDLNTFQQREWLHIGSTIFAWSCGMKAI